MDKPRPRPPGVSVSIETFSSHFFSLETAYIELLNFFFLEELSN